MLKMKNRCEKCQSSLSHDGLAFICSYECTFCPDCSGGMQLVCPNCQGELVKRPTRIRNPVQVLGSQIKTRLFGP